MQPSMNRTPQLRIVGKATKNGVTYFAEIVLIRSASAPYCWILWRLNPRGATMASIEDQGPATSSGDAERKALAALKAKTD